MRSGGTASGPRERWAREPRIRRTSASSSNGGTASSGKASGWLAGMAPLPSVVMTTGAPSASANATSAAPPPSAPPPARITGRFASAEHTGRFVDQREVGLLRAGQARAWEATRPRPSGAWCPSPPRWREDVDARCRATRRRRRRPDRARPRGRVLGPTDHAEQHAVLVGDLVQHATATTEVGGRDLADDAQHAASRTHRRLPARPMRSAARPGNDRAHPHPARDTRVAVGHVARRLLVTSVDDPNARAPARSLRTTRRAARPAARTRRRRPIAAAPRRGARRLCARDRAWTVTRRRRRSRS